MLMVLLFYSLYDDEWNLNVVVSPSQDDISQHLDGCNVVEYVHICGGGLCVVAASSVNSL